MRTKLLSFGSMLALVCIFGNRVLTNYWFSLLETVSRLEPDELFERCLKNRLLKRQASNTIAD